MMSHAANTSSLSRLAPLTFSIGFLEASVNVVGDALFSWNQVHHQHVVRTAVHASDLNVLHRLEPLTTPPRRLLVLETQSAWTAYFDNGVSGADPFGPISYLSEQLGCRGLIATNIPHTVEERNGLERGLPGAVQFELFTSEQREFLNYKRSISVAYDDGGWRFDANGAVQPFENTEQYNTPRIVERFTTGMLDHYCRAFAIRLMDEGFYGQFGILIEIRDRLPKHTRQYTLEEARREFRLG